MFLSLFEFRELWSPGLMIVVIFTSVIYFLITVKWRKDIQDSTPLAKQQAFYFLLSLFCLYVVKGSPVQVMTYLVYTAYAIQTVILFILIPFLMVNGIPNYLLAYIKRCTFIQTLLLHPIRLSLFWCGLFVVRQVPFVFDYLRLHETIESIYTIFFFSVSFLLMWSIQRQLKMHVFLIMYVTITIVAITIYFSPVALYRTYTDGAMWMQVMALCIPADTLNQLSAFSGPSLFTNMTPKQDQQLGSKLIQVIQTIIFGIILIAMRWNQKIARSTYRKIDHIL